MPSAALLLAVFTLCSACTADRSGTGSAASSASDTAAAEHLVLRIRPVLQGPEAATGSAAPATGTTSRDPAGPGTEQRAAADYATLVCNGTGSTGDTAQAGDPVAACTTDLTAKYLLGPTIIDGADITHARAATQQTTGEPVVLLYFGDAAEDLWAHYTAANVGTNVAFTLDGRVVSAPTIQAAIGSNPTTVSGSFTKEIARRLARDLDGG
jgi:preprotein translocase subunit SecD